MKALSLWQPWASAIAVGAKRIETRHWSTNYRGLIAIHAAKRMVKIEMIGFSSSWSWCGALRPLGNFIESSTPLWELLPFGALVATADLVDCRPTDSFTQAELDAPRRPEEETVDSYEWTERMMGDFSLGRFGWVLDNVCALPEPIPWKGAQGLFDVDDRVFE